MLDLGTLVEIKFEVKKTRKVMQKKRLKASFSLYKTRNQAIQCVYRYGFNFFGTKLEKKKQYSEK